MTGHVKCELQPAPHAEFVEGAAQVVLDDLLRGAYVVGDFTIGQALPDQGRHLRFLASELITGLHRKPLSGTSRWQALHVCVRR